MPDPGLADTHKRGSVYLQNWKGNWYIPFLSVMYFLMTVSFDAKGIVSVATAFAGMTAGAVLLKPVLPEIRQLPVLLKVILILNSTGILAGSDTHIYELWWRFLIRGDAIGIMSAVAIIAAVICSAAFIYICTSFLAGRLIRVFMERILRNDIRKSEWIIYTVVFLISAVYVSYVFLNSRAAWGRDYLPDLIYTADSQNLYNGNAYLNIRQVENDLRQPLFAVFSAPFTGIVFLAGSIFSIPPAYSALILGIAQLALLFVSLLIITRIMDLDRTGRICLILLFHGTYTFLLFSVMLEQYITAFFWLMLSIYCIIEDVEFKKTALFGACGTLVTSAALIPLLPGTPEKGKIRKQAGEMIRFGMSFLLLIISFGQVTVFLGISDNISDLSEFTGAGVGIFDRLCQFTVFVKDFFAAPEANVCTLHNFGKEYVSWQHLPVTGVSIAGMIIFALSVLSLILNRNRKSSLIAGYWILISVIVMVAVGWGTQENGLILYELYFGWPYLVLLYQLGEWITEKTKTSRFLPAFCMAATAVLLIINVPELLRFIGYMTTDYPA